MTAREGAAISLSGWRGEGVGQAGMVGMYFNTFKMVTLSKKAY